MSAIEVGLVKTSRPNVADGVDVSHMYYNASGKEIKYITFTYVPYNSVHDVVKCTIKGEAEVNGKLTGPIPPNHHSFIKWENMWYNATITSAVVTCIHVQYMDGTEEVIEGKDIVSLHDKNSAYYQNVGRKKEEEAKALREKRAAEEEKEKAIQEKKKEEQAEKDKRNKIIGWIIIGAVVLLIVYSMVNGLAADFSA